jgi:hypothetical protein
LQLLYQHMYEIRAKFSPILANELLTMLFVR